jgi:hypothetical protein
MPVLTVSSGGVPAGSYTGTFVGVEATEANPEKGFGPGIRWKFQIDAGAYAGQTVSRITGNTPSPKNACGMMLTGLMGRPIKEGEQIDPDTFRGKRYMIVVTASQGGGTRVEAIVPMPAA